MNKFDRIYALDRILRSHRYPVARRVLEERLDCSEKTVERTIRHMRDWLGAPIVYDREANGYRYESRAADRFELPGLWFSAGELAALCVLDRLLDRIEPGLLAEELAPARQRINRLIENEGLGLAHLRDRVRILDMAARQPGEAFHACAEALLAEKRLAFAYHSRSRDRLSEREISPQRLTHYRDNWYLDAWCHTSDALRTFAVERIHTARVLKTPARLLDRALLDRELAEAYGIFAGPVKHTAILVFSAERARWVADEQWHPRQHGEYLPNGRYRLEIPYGDDRELIGDILRHGAEVEVIAPEELRNAVARAARSMAELYE